MPQVHIMVPLGKHSNHVVQLLGPITCKLVYPSTKTNTGQQYLYHIQLDTLDSNGSFSQAIELINTLDQLTPPTPPKDWLSHTCDRTNCYLKSSHCYPYRVLTIFFFRSPAPHHRRPLPLPSSSQLTTMILSCWPSVAKQHVHIMPMLTCLGNRYLSRRDKDKDI